MNNRVFYRKRFEHRPLIPANQNKANFPPEFSTDFRLLQTISNQASVAIENARLYDEVQDFNKNLQAKVNEQTQEIRNKTKHLEKLLKIRSEFLDIASHQLRTPVSMTSV